LFFFSLILLTSLFLLVIVGVASYFYFGYHREKLTPKGTKIQGWVQGKKLDAIGGKVVSREGSSLTIENEGEEVTLEITGKVFYCGESGEASHEATSCSVMGVSGIRTGMYLTVDKKMGTTGNSGPYSLENGDFIVALD
jgi:hypothetical protein